MNILQQTLLHLIENTSQGLSEYEILKHIEKEHPLFFEELPDKNELYQKHFFLFHQLYQLKQHLSSKSLHLSISPLSIRITPSVSTGKALDEQDALAEFYNDKQNLYLSQDKIAAMQKKFWLRYLALQEKANAIQTLELTGITPLTLNVIKKAYKKLVNQYHPDKGGDTHKFQNIQTAYEELKQLY